MEESKTLTEGDFLEIVKDEKIPLEEVLKLANQLGVENPQDCERKELGAKMWSSYEKSKLSSLNASNDSSKSVEKVDNQEGSENEKSSLTLYRKGSAKFEIFQLLRSNATKKGFAKRVEERLAEIGKKSKNPSALIWACISGAKARGWSVEVVDGKYVVEKRNENSG